MKGGGAVSFIRDFQDATIGFSGYPRLARNRSNAFLFMAVLLFISVGIAALITTVQTHRLADRIVQDIQRGPDFGLSDGKFYYLGEMPRKVGGADGYMAVILDTTGRTSPDVLKSEPANSLLLTETTLYQVDSTGTVRATPWSAIPWSFTKDDVVEQMGQVYLWVPVLYLVIYALQLAFCALNAAILSSVAVTYARNLRRRITRQVGFRLALYAMSLPTLLSWVFPNFRNYTLRGFLLWWGITLIYLLQGIKACAADGMFQPPGGESN